MKMCDPFFSKLSLNATAEFADTRSAVKRFRKDAALINLSVARFI